MEVEIQEVRDGEAAGWNRSSRWSSSASCSCGGTGGPNSSMQTPSSLRIAILKEHPDNILWLCESSRTLTSPEAALCLCWFSRMEFASLSHSHCTQLPALTTNIYPKITNKQEVLILVQSAGIS
ncbi:hypothetical protein MATL_G00055860 [Megalops atlanticus]|uniref:Uncharacterized protein n=1 Tax=Megalops atlanticus TaxID=7932 RepID=A0A9D3Q7R9_MEGAT|nr:hypothetical protein MATL_G00055860 [Megalops atlanticus]